MLQGRSAPDILPLTDIENDADQPVVGVGLLVLPAPARHAEGGAGDDIEEPVEAADDEHQSE